MEKTMKVTGKSILKLSPDVTQIFLTIRGDEKEYSQCLASASEKLNCITSCLQSFGFDRKDLKTTDFSINPHNEPYYDEHNNRCYRQDGFSFYEDLKFSFPNDNKKLGQIMYALGQLSVCPEINIGYTISNKEEMKNTLMANAVKDAQKKATVLATAAGVRLGEIIDINYSWHTVEFESDRFSMNRNMTFYCANEAPSLNYDIEPDDLEESDTVTIIYKIL